MKMKLIKIRRVFLKLLIKIFSVFPIDKHKILVVSYWGKGFGDNGKPIIMSLHEKGKNYKYYWAIKKNEKGNFPNYVIPVPYLSLQYFYHLATAKVWIDNSRKSVYVTKRKGQYYIQTWHADPMLKRVEKDAEKALESDYVRWAKHDSQIADLVIANSDFGVDFFRRGFWYEGEIYKAGAPRLDILKNKEPEIKRQILNKLTLPEEKKILLYAPTFRVDHDLSCYFMNYEELKKILEQTFGGNWSILVRLHPNMSHDEVEALNIKYSDWLINASYFEDMYELIHISDVLVTDYSSTMFEAASAKEPVFLYASDYEAYLQDRGFYFEYEKLPFPNARSFIELLNKIMEFNYETYEKNVNEFLEEVGMLEPGGAASNVADRIIEIIEQREECL